MLIELAVTDLGVIDEARLVLGSGLTALTGETGAGKTMLVEAISLLLGSRAEPAMVRPGATEAVIEGRFDAAGDEVVLRRVIPRDGRSRAYLDGRMVTAGELAARGAELVDLLGQSAHQALRSTPAQRAALDRAASIDLLPLEEARRHAAEIRNRLDSLGGDAGARAREIDLLRFQLAELVGADLVDPDEDASLEEQEEVLADAAAHREDAQRAVSTLMGEGAARDSAALAATALRGHTRFVALADRVAALTVELEDLATEIRDAGEAVVEDPEQLEAVRARRQLLAELVRKYGTASPTVGGGGSLADVIAYTGEVEARLAELEAHDERAATLEEELRAAVADVARAEAVVGSARRKAAPDLAAGVTTHLRKLALPDARVEVEVGEADPGDEVAILLVPHRGASPRPVAASASGGELARTGLALRLELTADQPCLVFDEVDAGIGGEAAVAVGRALSELAAHRQVLVVTHLAQVAAFASTQIAVAKRTRRGVTTSHAAPVTGEDRLTELSRMLSGRSDSGRARAHAAELLAEAQGQP